MKRLTCALAFVLLAALPRAASAFPSWMQEGKAGRFMFNLKLGPAATLKAFSYGSPVGTVEVDHRAQGAIVFDFGISLDQAHNAYILLGLQFQANADSDYGSWIMLPVGFEYDIPIHAVPGLYICPRFSLGYAAFVYNSSGTNDNVNAGFILPEVEGKFIFNRRWNVGFQPFSLPVFFGSQCFNGGHGCVTVTWVSWRVLFSGGVNF
jgi:hypothetical protein